MPILIKEYEYQEDEEHLYLTVSLNGRSPKNVDIYCNDSYLKINFSPFFFELDFYDKVDEDTSSANISQTEIKISIKKETPGIWGRASVFNDEEEKTKPEKKEWIKKRREEAFDRSLEKTKEKQKQKRIFNNQQKREMVQKQMDVERAEREKIKEIKDKAAEEAKKDLYSWINNEKHENPEFLRRRYEDDDDGRIREIESDEEDDEIEANVDIWSDQDSIVEEEVEGEEEEKLESITMDPWKHEAEEKDKEKGKNDHTINDFMKKDKRLDALVQRKRQHRQNQQDKQEQQNHNNKEESNYHPPSNTKEGEGEREEIKEWERLTEVQTTEANDPVKTEGELNLPLTEEDHEKYSQESTAKVYQGPVIEDISEEDEEDDEFDMEAIKAKVQREMARKKEKELEEKLGKRYYRITKASQERTLPPPRALNQRINITFTPRDRPTAARESEDEKYRNHMKRQRAIKASLDKLHDSKGIQEESGKYS